MMPEANNPKPRPLLADIARRLGMHISTVSRALQNSPLLPAATRKKIQRLAREMGYRKDPCLTSLAEYRKRKRLPSTREAVAYVSSWGAHETDLTSWQAPEQTPFFIEARKVLEYCGYHLEHFSLRQPGMSPSVITRILRERGARGVIVGGFSHPVKRLELDWRHFCAVRADLIPQWPELHTVGNDRFQIMQVAFENALEAGYQRIGFSLAERMDSIAHPAYSSSFVFQQFQNHKMERLPMNIHSWEDARGFHTWFHQHRPEVIIGGIQEWRWLKAGRVCVPRDVAFVSIYKNIQDSEVSGMYHENGYCGRRAAELLTGLMQHSEYGAPKIPTITFVHGRWSPGKTLPRKRRK